MRTRRLSGCPRYSSVDEAVRSRYITDLLGRQPEMGLEEGVGRLIDWYRAEREWACKVI